MMIPENDGTVATLATLGKTSIHQALEGLASEFAQNAQYQKQLCRTVSLGAFCAELISIAEKCEIIINNNDLEEVIELVLKVEYPYCISSPRVGFSLTDFPFLVRVRLVLGWIGNQIASLLVAPPPYGSRFWWLKGWRARFAPKFASYCHEAAPGPPIYDFTNAEFERMQAAFTALGDATWRLHLDWEDQQFGPDVYDLSLHKINGAKDIGYMENMLRAHSFAATTLGRRLDRHHYVHLHRMCVSYLGERQTQYNPSVRELWHPRDWSDDDIYHGIDARHLRIVKFSGFEALAMNHALFSEPERFRKAYPLFAEVVEKKCGELAVTRDMLNREFVRFQVCYFDRPYDGVDIAEKIDARFEEFYTTVAPLDARRRELARQVSRGGPDEAARTTLNDMQKAILLEISRLHRWCEYLRPFNEGNTRFSILILNKLLVEYGFSLSITAQRNDVLFRSDRGWCAYIIEGMQRAVAIQQFGALGLLDHILAMRPEKYRRQRVTMPAF